MSGPTQTADQNVTSTWASRPRLARLVRVSIAVVPLVATFLLTWTLGRTFPPERLGVPLLVWWLMLVVAANVVLATARRVSRRFVPIAALLKVSLIFPDQAPSRMRVALRRHSGKKLLAELAELGDDPNGARPSAELLFDILHELNEHDRLTRGHSERVRAYTELIAEQLELPEADCERLRWGALLHDIGKLTVPAEILNKNGRPDDDEWAILQNHPAAAVEMMDPMRPWLGEWALAAEQHHMRWDGKGYPLPLAGEEISLAGRIVAVADAYDTMTSARSYKKAMSTEVARREIADCAGSQFDPTVVRAFLAVGIGRLRAVLGPLGTIAGLLEQARLPLRPGTIISLTSGAATVAVASVVGLISPTTDLPPAGVERLVTLEASDDFATGAVDTVLEARVLENDRHDGAVTLSIVAHPTRGTAEVSGAVIRFRPESGWTGTETAVYEIADSTGATATAVVTFVVNRTTNAMTTPTTTTTIVVSPSTTIAPTPTVDATPTTTLGTTTSTTTTTTPVAPLPLPQPAADVATVLEDGTIMVKVLANDVLGGLPLDRVVIVAPPGKGTARVDEANRIAYAPNEDSNGSDTLRYALVDTGGRVSPSARLSLSIVPINDPPSFTPGGNVSTPRNSGPYDNAWSGAVSPGPADEAGQTVSFTVSTDNAALFLVAPRIDADGRLTFTHSGLPGSADVTVRAVDDGGTVGGGVDTSTAITFRITIAGVNVAPIGVADAAVTLEDTAVVIGVVGNDTDPEDGTPTGAVSIASAPAVGTAVVQGDRTIRYTPGADVSGPDTFSYRVADSSGALSAPTTVVVSVTAVNDRPTFTPGPAVSANEDGGAIVHSNWATDLRAGPVDELGQSLGFTVTNDNAALFATPPSMSPVNGNLTYALNPNANGTATLLVTLTDDGGTANGGLDTSITRSATLTVNATPDDPIATPDSYGGTQDVQLVVGAPGLLGNDTDPDGDVPTVNTVAVALPTDGTLSLSADGSFTYDPDPGWSGTDNFTYEIDDGTGRTDSAVVTVAIAPASGPSIVISQFAAAGSHSGGDFVELYNATGATVDIGGWELRITDSGGITDTVTIPAAGADLPPGGFYLLGESGSAHPWDAPFANPLTLSVGLGLHDGVGYVDQVGTQARPEARPTQVLASIWAEGTGVTPFDLSLGGYDQTNRRRVDFGAGHCTDTDDNSLDFLRRFAAAPRSTVSDPEPCGALAPPAPVGHVVISEVRTDGPFSGQNEFTEIFNPTGAAIPLGDLELRDADGDIEYDFPVMDLLPGQHYLIKGGSYTGAFDGEMDDDGIKNGGSVHLWDTVGSVIVDEVSFGNAAPDLPKLGGRLTHSYQRRFDGCMDTPVLLDDFTLAFAGDPQTSADPATPC